MLQGTNWYPEAIKLHLKKICIAFIQKIIYNDIIDNLYVEIHLICISPLFFIFDW